MQFFPSLFFPGVDRGCFSSPGLRHPSRCLDGNVSSRRPSHIFATFFLSLSLSFFHALSPASVVSRFLISISGGKVPKPSPTVAPSPSPVPTHTTHASSPAHYHERRDPTRPTTAPALTAVHPPTFTRGAQPCTTPPSTCESPTHHPSTPLGFSGFLLVDN